MAVVYNILKQRPKTKFSNNLEKKIPSNHGNNPTHIKKDQLICTAPLEYSQDHTPERDQDYTVSY